MGLKLLAPIQKGDFIMEYVGEVRPCGASNNENNAWLRSFKLTIGVLSTVQGTLVDAYSNQSFYDNLNECRPDSCLVLLEAIL